MTNDEPLARWSQPSATTRSTDGAARCADLAGEGIRGQVDVRRRQLLEADEDVRQAAVVEELAELEDDLRRRREERVDDPQRDRALGDLGEVRERPGGDDAAGEPEDEDRLRRRRRSPPPTRSRAPRKPVAERLRGLPAHRSRRAPRRSRRGPSRTRQHDDRADRRGQLVEQGRDRRQDRQARERGDGGAGEAEELGERAGPDAEQDGDHDQDDREQVQGVHRPIVTQVRCRGPLTQRRIRSRARRCRCSSAGQPDLERDRLARRPRRRSSTCRRRATPRSTAVALSSAISMHTMSPGPEPSITVSGSSSRRRRCRPRPSPAGSTASTPLHQRSSTMTLPSSTIARTSWTLTGWG